jgi:hypothetical protein
MSRKLGHKLPDEVYDLIDAKVERQNVVILLSTIDDLGFPHSCLLSPYQVIAFKKGGKITLLIYSNSSTSSNLIMRKIATLVFVIPPKAFYIKGEAELEPKSTSADSNRIFSLTVKETSEDYSPEAPILSSVRFDETRIRDGYQASYRQVIESLRTQSS